MSVSIRLPMLPSPYGCGLDLRGFSLSGPPGRSLSLRPGNSLTILKMALSMGFRYSVSLISAIQATGLLTSTPVGLTPTEHTSLSWTHVGSKTGAVQIKPVSNPLLVKRSMRISRTTLPCQLRLKVYVTYLPAVLSSVVSSNPIVIE